MKFILRWAINTVALYVAVVLLQKFNLIYYTGNWIDIIWLALIFGLVNAILRPPFKALSCLLIILTLGLFTLVINTLLLASASLSSSHGSGALS
jgi:putative membrane protein